MEYYLYVQKTLVEIITALNRGLLLAKKFLYQMFLKPTMVVKYSKLQILFFPIAPIAHDCLLILTPKSISFLRMSQQTKYSFV